MIESHRWRLVALHTSQQIKKNTGPLPFSLSENLSGEGHVKGLRDGPSFE